MSRALASLLNQPEKDVSKQLEKLEGLSGFNREDIRFVQDIKHQTAQKIASLGLDPNDTTGEELYQALIAKLSGDLEHINRALNHSPSTDIDEIVSRSITLANLCGEAPSVLAIRPSSIKKLLRTNPPKKLMKRLHYRSLDSMLKRSNAAELLALAPAVESANWLKGLEKSISKLAASDYEIRQVQFLAANSIHWSGPNNLRNCVTYAPLAAIAVAWPATSTREQNGLYTALLLLQASEILQVDSFYLSKYLFQADFGKIAADLYAHDQHRPFMAEESTLGWRDLWRLSTHGDSAIDKLSKVHPALDWWRGAEHLVHSASQPVSLNLADNLANLHSSASYEKRAFSNAAHNLKSQLFSRYAVHAGVNNYLTGSLNDNLVLETNEEQVPQLSAESI